MRGIWIGQESATRTLEVAVVSHGGFLKYLAPGGKLPFQDSMIDGHRYNNAAFTTCTFDENWNFKSVSEEEPQAIRQAHE